MFGFAHETQCLLAKYIYMYLNNRFSETSKVREDGLEDGTALNTFDKLIHTIGKDIFGIRRSKNNRLNYRGNSRK